MRYRAAFSGLLLAGAAACSLDAVGSMGDAGVTPPGPTSDGGDVLTDGGPPDGAAGPVCTRAVEVRNAPLSLYDTFRSGAVTPAAADELLRDVALAGGTPLETPGADRVVFLAKSAVPLRVVGSFVEWKAESSVAMLNVSGTDLWVLDLPLPDDTSHEYKLLDPNGTFVEDPLARNVTWDGLDRGFGVRGEMNAVARARFVPKDKGRLTALGKVHATALADDRDVWVYTPPKYDDGTCTKLPSIAFHDGNESLTRGAFAREADTLYAAQPGLSAVLVFVGLPSQDVRMDEYSFGTATARGPDYVAFLATELVPALSSSHRLCSKPAARGIAGASLGGLISAYGAFEKPDVWGWVGSQSGSYFWAGEELTARVQNEAVRPVRFYLDSGNPGDNYEVTNNLAAALSARGYDHVRVTADNAEHDWPDWRARFAGMAKHFRENQTACD